MNRAAGLPGMAKWDPVQANDLASAGSIAALDDLMARCFGTDFSIRIEVDEKGPWWITDWEVVTPYLSRLRIGRLLNGQWRDRLQWRIFSMMPLIAAYHQSSGVVTGRVAINLEDFGLTPGLAFCENRPGYFLIPDPDFIGNAGYAQMRWMAANAPVAWEDRAPCALWRGSDFGLHVEDWQDLPRVRLCQIAREHGALFDVGITDIRHGRFAEQIKASGLMRDRVHGQHFNRYRAHVDIDGRSNAWAALLYKLISASPVLKVASPTGYRQWYYDRLKPWINFVPVASDMSDLAEKAIWLRDHDEAARQIGLNGHALAMSLDYDRELQRGCRTISAALRHAASACEISLGFGAADEGGRHLHDGWAEPGDDGVSAVGVQSGLRLPKPVAGTDFVLALDVSPVLAFGMPASQRICVVANGEILHQSVLAARAEIRCGLSRPTIEQSDTLDILLLHPDAARVASASRPLDAAVLSIVLHRVTLTADTGQVAAPVVAPAHTVSTRQSVVMKALYGRDIWQNFAPAQARNPEIQGWNGRHPILAELLETVPGHTVFDIGVWKGQSTIFLAEQMRARKLDGCVVAVDAHLHEELWNGDGILFKRHPGGRPDVFDTFLDNAFHAGVSDLIVPLAAGSAAAARQLARSRLTAGLIHLDASRDYVQALADARAYWPLLEPGGALVGDDYAPGWPGVIRAAHEFAAGVQLELEVFGLKWVVRKPLG